MLGDRVGAGQPGRRRPVDRLPAWGTASWTMGTSWHARRRGYWPSAMSARLFEFAVRRFGEQRRRAPVVEPEMANVVPSRCVPTRGSTRSHRARLPSAGVASASAWAAPRARATRRRRRAAPWRGRPRADRSPATERSSRTASSKRHHRSSGPRRPLRGESSYGGPPGFRCGGHSHPAAWARRRTSASARAAAAQRASR
jgi:hypothetical protein